MQPDQARQLIDSQLEALSEALAAGQSDRLQAFLATMARFHRYSLGNTLLIMVQSPEATHVAGFATWLKLGRAVRKGEKGIAILVPIRPKAQAEDEKEKPDAKAKAKDGEEDERPVRFKVGYVFDVSQTEGDELPSLARPEGDPGQFLPQLRNLVSDMEIALEYRDDLGGADGLSSGGLIAIRQGLSPAEEFSTLVHELAHEKLHKGEGRVGTTKRSRELEAEAVACVVSQGVGLLAEPASSDYIQLYGGDKDALAASLFKIRDAAASILAALDAGAFD